jgi:hypothetical protein
MKKEKREELKASTDAAYVKMMAAWDKFFAGINKSYGKTVQKER